ncbi:hypothetical protein FSC845_02365 [Francisella persica ATCC VR-331]|nr:hypothetical protein FSC845_02365 [Francisella persica ATCC VR-331]
MKSRRSHDTGMVILISQNINEFELHLHAILGLPIPTHQTLQPCASAATLLEEDTTNASIYLIKYSYGIVSAKAENTH